MPKLTISVYQPDDDTWWKATADAGDKERLEREKQIDRVWTYYYGNQTPPLKVRAGQPDYNVILNLAGQAVDSMVAFLGVPRFTLPGGVQEVPDETGALAKVKTPQQELLDQWWQANDLKLFIVDLLLSGFLGGHTFLKLLPDERSYTPDGAAAPVILPGVELLDPRLATVFWSSYRQPLFYRLKWKVSETETRTQDIVPDALLFDDAARAEMALSNAALPQTWSILEYAEKNSQRRVLVGNDPWNYPFAPVVDWKNAPAPFTYYGRSDLSLATLKKNDAANFVASNIQKIIAHHAGPQTIITGGRANDDQEWGPDVVIDDLDKEAKVYNLEMVSDLVSSSNHLMMLRGAFFESMRVVDRASVKDKLGDLTNFAVRMLYGAQLDAGYDKQSRYGEGLAETSRRALALMGVAVPRVLPEWDDPLPQDRKELVESVKAESEIGLTSGKTLLVELGHDPPTETAQKAREQTDRSTALGGFLAGLGQKGLL